MRFSRAVVLVSVLALATATTGCRPDGTLAGDRRQEASETPSQEGKGMGQKVVKSEDEWRELLTPEQFAVCRQKGTERAFTGQYWDHHEPGVYRCAACGAELFRSDAKFDSSTGWPSFTEPAAKESVRSEEDRSLFMNRTEVLCASCGAHLGHLFPDGPKPTGLRYCINSVCLDFAGRK